MEIGERIKARRLQLKMSQDELARKIGYTSRSTINKIELGGNKLRQDKIAAIAKALDTTPSYIMGWDEEQEKPTDTKTDGLKNEICDLYEALPPADQREAIAFLKGLLASHKHGQDQRD